MPPPLNQRKIKTGVLTRIFGMEERSIDAEKRTVALTFSSETPYERWFGMEVLDHSPKSIRLGRLKDGGCVLVDHKGDQIGCVEEVSIGADRRGHAVLRFGKGQRASEVFQDIVDKIRRNVSVGYLIHALDPESEENGLKTYRATDWEPYEISIVGVPADPSIGVGRSAIHENHETIIQGVKNMPPDNEPAAPVSTPSVTGNRALEDAARQAEQRRCIEISNMGRKHDLNDEAQRAIGEGQSLDQFRAMVLDKLAERGASKPIAVVNPAIGMSQKEARRFSVVRAMNLLANKHALDGIEREASDAVGKLIGREAQGFFIPHEVRSLSAGTASAGGALIQDSAQGQSMIDLLRNTMAVEGMGATILSGLVGNCPIPKQTGGATAYWLGEGAEVTASQQTFGQVLLQPKRLAAVTGFSKQLLAQSSYDVEGLVRRDLATVLALALDSKILTGVGGSEPLGIANTTGITTITFSGAATWADCVDMEYQVENGNVQITRGGYLLSPAAKGKFKSIEKSSGSGQWLWMDNEINGYPAKATAQVPATSRAVFGNWPDLLVGYWEGMDIVVDPYTLAAYNQIRIVVNQHADAALRYPGAFCVSTDSAAQ